jgi:hypothetical protein
VHRAGHELDTLLADVVAKLPRPAGTVSAFVHGETAATRSVRRPLLAEGIATPNLLSCSPYPPSTPSPERAGLVSHAGTAVTTRFCW